MKFVLFLIWMASTIDVTSSLQLAGFRSTGVLWSVVSFCVILYTLHTYPFDRIPLSPLRNNAWVLFAFAYYCLRSINSDNFLYAIVDLQSLFLPTMIGLLSYETVQSYNDCQEIEATVLKSIVVPLTLLGIGITTGLSTFVEGIGQKGFIGARSVSLYGITVLSVAIPVLIYDKANTKKKHLALFAAGICFFCILATLSRTALLSSIIMLLFAGVLTMNIKKFAKSFIVIIFVIIIALKWGPMAERLMPNNAESLGDVAQSGEFTSGRALLWTYIFQEGLQHPIMGTGTGNVKTLIESNMRSSGILPHNEYLRFFYDGGIIGLSIICTALLSRLRRHLNDWRNALRKNDFMCAKWNLAALLVTLAMATSALFENVFLYQFMLCIAFTIYGITDKLSDLKPIINSDFN
ncbi:MAG: O-antigen ligase family protein [Sulfurimonas sp.]|nr:O-antigen ligase family protein [Sulfurimonas sp.]